MINLKNANILVTGGTGFIGSHLIEALLKQKANVISFSLETDPLSYFCSQKLDKKVKSIILDICEFDKVFNLITRFQIDYIFHLAAQSLVEIAFHNPQKTLQTNILGTVNILESARLYPRIKGIVVASSDKAYGKILYSCHSDQAKRVEESRSLSASLLAYARDPSTSLGMTHRVKYIETDPLKGDHPYEASKSAADLISYSYHKTYQLPVTVTRFGNVYGEGDLNFSRIIPGTIKSIVKNEILEIRSDGQYVRDYLYVKDVVTGYILLAKNIGKIKGEAFNFGSKETLSVLQVIKLMEKHLGKKIK